MLNNYQHLLAVGGLTYLLRHRTEAKSSTNLNQNQPPWNTLPRQMLQEISPCNIIHEIDDGLIIITNTLTHNNVRR